MDEKWYLAELIEEFHAIDQDASLLHINWVLISADDPEKAYTKSLQFGQDLNREFLNTEGILVTVRFRGLRDLNEIHEELADGSEIVFEEIEEINNSEIEHLIATKDQLSVFKARPDQNLR